MIYTDTTYSISNFILYLVCIFFSSCSFRGTSQLTTLWLWPLVILGDPAGEYYFLLYTHLVYILWMWLPKIVVVSINYCLCEEESLQLVCFQGLYTYIFLSSILWMFVNSTTFWIHFVELSAEQRFQSASEQHQESIKHHLGENGDTGADNSCDEDDLDNKVLDKIFQSYSSTQGL